jgi:hypothetical protein
MQKPMLHVTHKFSPLSGKLVPWVMLKSENPPIPMKYTYYEFFSQLSTYN